MFAAPIDGRGELGRSGRKRKAGKRHPSGELVRDKRPDDRIRASRQPHRRGLKEGDRLSEKAESPLGRLNLRGIISDDQYEGCQHFVALVGQYRSTIGAPRSIGGSGRGGGCPGDCATNSDACVCLQRRERYMRAYEALAAAGRAAVMAIIRVAVQREELGRGEDEVNLLAGSSALARHFGLTGRRHRVYSENAH
jgi:hypothetical protein